MAPGFLTADSIVEALEPHSEELKRRFGVRRLAVFGSCARGEAGQGSDVDLLVAFEETTFDRYMDLKFRLEELLGASVDLVLEDSLKPRLRPRVVQEAVHVAGL